MFKKSFCIIGILLIALSGNAQQKPNIIFILTDDMGYGDLSCYGSKNTHTPFLDHLATNGFKSTGFMVVSPSCTPSRTSFFTGKYPTRTGLVYAIPPGSKLSLPIGGNTLAGFLKNAGYATTMIGKWHMGDKGVQSLPTAHGFDSYFGLLYSHDYKLPYVVTDTVLKIYKNTTPFLLQPKDSNLTELYTKEAVQFIEKQSAKQPFYLYLAHNMPHLPLASSTAHQNRSKGGLYGDVVEEIDASTERIVAVLKQKKLLDNTLIIFTSDNGPWIDFPARMASDGFTQPNHVGSTGVFRGKKAQTYEGGHRVPFIVYWNKKIKPSSNDQLISSLDLWPTIANVLQQPMPAADVFDGESVWHTITNNNNSKPHQPVYYLNDGKVEAVRNGDWKYRKTIKAGEQVEELFNLKTDPSEKNNVFNLQPKIANSMAALLNQYPK